MHACSTEFYHKFPSRSRPVCQPTRRLSRAITTNYNPFRFVQFNAKYSIERRLRFSFFFQSTRRGRVFSSFPSSPCLLFSKGDFFENLNELTIYFFPRPRCVSHGSISSRVTCRSKQMIHQKTKFLDAFPPQNENRSSLPLHFISLETKHDRGKITPANIVSRFYFRANRLPSILLLRNRGRPSLSTSRRGKDKVRYLSIGANNILI